jgi:hypothetical protein
LKSALLYVGLAILALVGVIVAIWLLIEPSLTTLRDVILVALGFFFLLFALLLVGVGIMLLALLGMLRSRLPSLLDKAGSTAETVRGTTGFVGERVASPLIKASAAAAGARAAVQTMFRRDNHERR